MIEINSRSHWLSKDVVKRNTKIYGKGIFIPAPSSGTGPNEIFSILILGQLRYEGCLLILSLSVLSLLKLRICFTAQMITRPNKLDVEIRTKNLHKPNRITLQIS